MPSTIKSFLNANRVQFRAKILPSGFLMKTSSGPEEADFIDLNGNGSFDYVTDGQNDQGWSEPVLNKSLDHLSRYTNSRRRPILSGDELRGISAGRLNDTESLQASDHNAEEVPTTEMVANNWVNLKDLTSYVTPATGDRFAAIDAHSGEYLVYTPK